MPIGQFGIDGHLDGGGGGAISWQGDAIVVLEASKGVGKVKQELLGMLELWSFWQKYFDHFGKNTCWAIGEEMVVNEIVVDE